MVWEKLGHIYSLRVLAHHLRSDIGWSFGPRIIPPSTVFGVLMIETYALTTLKISLGDRRQ